MVMSIVQGVAARDPATSPQKLLHATTARRTRKWYQGVRRGVRPPGKPNQIKQTPVIFQTAGGIDTPVQTAILPTKTLF